MARNTLLIVVYSILFALVVMQAQARPLTTEQRLQDFRQLVSLMAAEYGPLDYKKNQGIADLSVLSQKYESEILQSKSNQEFYNIIFRFVASFQDGHYVVRVPTTRTFSVPFQADLIQGKALITFIDQEKIKAIKFPFALGDEIVSVNGKNIEDYIQSMLPFIGTGNPKSARSYAIWSLTARRGARTVTPTEKSVTFEIRHGQSNIIETVKLDWTVTGEAIDEDETLELPENLGKISAANQFIDFKFLLNPAVEMAGPNADRRYMCNPISRVAIPEGAKIITEKPFTSYIYNSAKGPIGYVRIPDYYPTDESGNFSEDAAKKYFEKYKYVIAEFEKNTKALVIDQDHNCGGSVALVEDMISLFMNSPFPAQQFRLRTSKSTYLDVKSELAKLDKQTLAYQIWNDVFLAIEKAWKTTKESLTSSVTITGRNTIYPDREANYTKPILILIDQEAGSGGDAFPSLMKGFGRAKLFGQQTGGLGGSVGEYPKLFHSQMLVNMTATQFYKPDGSPVENNGAVPDMTYEITRDDFLYGFKNYQKAYTKAVEDLIKE